MGIHVIKMPDIGEGIAEVELVAWHVKPGDAVVEDQALADVMTDKASVEIPSPVAAAPAKAAVAAHTPDAPASPAERPRASPSVRRRASELELDLRALSGTGPGGRIVHADLEVPVERITGWDTPYPHSLEWAYFPGPDRVGAAMRRAMEAT